MKQRLEFLDSLRGIAASYVCFYHMALIPQPNLAVPGWADAVVRNGGTGVTLFFMTSAFSLCYTSFQHAGETSPVLAFYVRRFFRIAPLFYLVLIFYLLRDHWYFGLDHGLLEVAMNALLLFNFWPGHETGVVWASWTIGVEMVFYAVFPLLIRFASSASRAGILVLASLLAPLLFHELLSQTNLPPEVSGSYVKFSILFHLPVFMAGILTYRIFRTCDRLRVPPQQLGLLLTLGAAYLYASLLRGTLNGIFTDPYYWQAVVYGCLMLGLALNPVRLIVNRCTLLLGRMSYSLYLVHPSAVLFLTPVYRKIGAIFPNPTVAFGLCAALTLSIVAAISAVTYALVEEPGIQLGKRILAWIEVRRPFAATR